MTVFDRTEPKVGSRFLVGYPSLDVDRGRAYIFGAIELNDNGQAQLYAEVQRHLSIEAAARDSNFGPYVTALKDQVAWIRDLSARRLVQSDRCDESSACQEALLAAARYLIVSKGAATVGKRCIGWNRSLNRLVIARKVQTACR